MSLLSKPWPPWRNEFYHLQQTKQLYTITMMAYPAYSVASAELRRGVILMTTSRITNSQGKVIKLTASQPTPKISAPAEREAVA